MWSFVQIGVDDINGELLPYYTIVNAGASGIQDADLFSIDKVKTGTDSGVNSGKKVVAIPNTGTVATGGKELCVESADGGYDQLWYLDAAGDGLYYIVARGTARTEKELCLTVKNGGVENGTQVVTARQKGTANQQWKLIEVDQYD